METVGSPALRAAFWFALFAGVSALLGTYAGNLGLEAKEPPGPTMLLTGVWFSLAVIGGMARLGHGSVKTVAVAFILILVGWQVAYHIAFGLSNFVNEGVIGYGKANYGSGELVGGVLAGATGATFTWAAGAYIAPGLRTTSIALKLAVAGAILGLLLPAAIEPNRLWLLLVPWQVGVAGLLGFLLVKTQA